MSAASSSFDVPPRRPIGLMVALVVLDIGLAAAGAVLLSKGLAGADKPKHDPKAEPAAVEKKSEAPVPAAAPASSEHAASAPAVKAPAMKAPAMKAPAMTSAKAATPSAAPTPPVAAPPSARKDTTKQRDDKKLTAPPAKTTAAGNPTLSKPAPATPAPAKPAPTKPAAEAKPVASEPTEARPVTTEPQDPYGPADKEPDTEHEIDAAAAKSKAAFDRCAAAHGSVQGAIRIAFQVSADGRVTNAAPVENTTGNAELARCLVAEMSSWRVSAHQGAAINMLRPFTYR